MFIQKKHENSYPLVIEHSNGKSQFSIDYASSNGGFSIAMLVYQSVSDINDWVFVVKCCPSQKQTVLLDWWSRVKKNNTVITAMFFYIQEWMMLWQFNNADLSFFLCFWRFRTQGWFQSPSKTIKVWHIGWRGGNTRKNPATIDLDSPKTSLVETYKFFKHP